MLPRRLLLTLGVLLAPLSSALAGELDGSPASMKEQHAIAVDADYSFLRKPADVEHLVEIGRLVDVSGNADYTLSDVSFAVARPEVRAFIESVAADYQDEFGVRLVVTSLTRPTALQPLNAHDLSVHPAGMATDLRVPADSSQREWLETRLLALEDSGAIDVTREHHPSHYHVAVFAEKYLPIAVVEDSLRVDRRARAEVARFARLSARPMQASAAMPIGLLLLGAVWSFAVAAPLAVIRRRRRR